MAHAHPPAQSPGGNPPLDGDADNQTIRQEIISAIEDFHERYHALNESFTNLVSPKQWELIEAVAESDEAVTLTRLGEKLGCSRQNAKKLAAAAQKQQLVEMRNGPNNSVLVDTTARWEGVSEHVAQRRLEAESSIFDNFSDDELQQLKDLLNRLAASLTPPA